MHHQNLADVTGKPKGQILVLCWMLKCFRGEFQFRWKKQIFRFSILVIYGIRIPYTVYGIRHAARTYLQRSNTCAVYTRFPFSVVHSNQSASCSLLFLFQIKSLHSLQAYSYFCFPLTSYSTLLLATLPLCYTYYMTLHCMNEMKWSTEQLLSAAVASHCRW